MSNQDNNIHNDGSLDATNVVDREIEAMEASLDRLGAMDRAAAPADFEEHMASTTLFALTAASSARMAGGWAGTSYWQTPIVRIAAVLALSVAGVLAWSLTLNAPHNTNVVHKDVGGTIARTPPGADDDSEIYSIVAMVFDEGAGSDIDSLLSEASELDSKIGVAGQGLLDFESEPVEGSTM